MFPCQLGGVGIGDSQPHWNLQEIRDLERRLAESERRNDRLEACRCVLHCWAKYTGVFFPQQTIWLQEGLWYSSWIIQVQDVFPQTVGTLRITNFQKKVAFQPSIGRVCGCTVVATLAGPHAIHSPNFAAEPPKFLAKSRSTSLFCEFLGVFSGRSWWLQGSALPGPGSTGTATSGKTGASTTSWGAALAGRARPGRLDVPSLRQTLVL